MSSVAQSSENLNCEIIRLEHAEYLSRRGVLNAAAALNWRSCPWHDGTPGLAIPVTDAGGTRERFRAIEAMSDGTKTRWRGRSGSYTPKYYYPPDVDKAVAANDGELILAAGEFDLLTFVEVGQRNVVTFASENSVPQNLIEQLKAWGVTRVRYWPDADDAGRLSARKVADTLKGSGIEFIPYDLRDLVEAKGDTNDLWQVVNFDRDAFLATLQQAPHLTLPLPERPRPDPTPIYSWVNDDDYEREREELKTQVGCLLGIDGYRHDGWSRKNVLSPFRHERNPSASYNIHSGVLKDFGGGTHNLKELAEHFGLEYPRRRLRRRDTWRGNLDAVPGDDQAKDLLEQGNEAIIAATGELAADDFTPDVTVNERWCSDIPLTARTIALKSPLNTGKTEAVIRHIRATKPKRILLITHLQSLTSNQAERVNSAGNSVHLYSEIDDEFANLGSVDKLVCTLDSLHRLAGAEPYDLIVFDEAEQGLRHIWGGTMKRRKIDRCYRTLKEHLVSAGQVIALDAHMSAVTPNLLEKWRGEVTCIKNTYRHDWNNLTFFEDVGALIDAATYAIEQNAGPVVITAGSRELARTLQDTFSSYYGEDTVLAVHGWNSASKQARDSVKHINDRLPALRVLITSPSVGTGVDISAPVAAVFGHFTGSHLDAGEIMQQMARYRNARFRGIYIPYAKRRNLITDPEELLERERNRVKRTAQLADFQDHDVAAATLEQAEITRLWAELTARSNRSKVCLRDAVAGLAVRSGSRVRLNTSQSPKTKKALYTALKEREDKDDEIRLQVTPLTGEELRRRCVSGEVREEDFLAYERWRIEHTLGQPITPDLLKEYKHKKARLALERFTDFFLHDERVKQKDRDDAAALPFQREHHTAARRLFESCVKVVFGLAGLDSDEEIPAEELARRMQPFVSKHLQDIQYYLDRRFDLSSDPIRIFHRILDHFGLALESSIATKHDEQGQRRRVYKIDAERLEVMRERARIRIQYLRKLEEQQDVQNTGIDSLDSRVPCIEPPSERGRVVIEHLTAAFGPPESHLSGFRG
jgi:hypothetical protein